MEKINVGLYGGKSIFGGRETPVRAEIVYCDRMDSCYLYKNGKCLNVTAPFSARCTYGKVVVVTGYTSKAKKYHTFMSQYKNDEQYRKLKYPSNCRVAVMGDYVYVDVVYSRLEEQADGQYKVRETGFLGSTSWIPVEKFTVDVLYRICSYKAYAMMGGEITEYREERVPEFLYQLRRVLPDLYQQFISKWPEYDIAPNHVGKYAKLSTVNRELPVIDNFGHKFYFDGDYLISKDYKSSFAPFGANTVEMRIKITDDMKVKITDNAQVTEDTVFE